MELGQIIFGKLAPVQESELASKGWYRHSEYGVILQQGQDIPQDVGKELMRQYTKGQIQQGAGLFYPTQKETGTYNVETQTYISPTGAKQSMGLEQAKQIGAVIPLPTQTQIQQMPQTARTLLEVKPVYSNGQLTGFNDTRLNVSYSLQNIPESRKQDLVRAGIIPIEQPTTTTQNIPAQTIQGKTFPVYSQDYNQQIKDLYKDVENQKQVDYKWMFNKGAFNPNTGGISVSKIYPFQKQTIEHEIGHQIDANEQALRDYNKYKQASKDWIPDFIQNLGYNKDTVGYEYYARAFTNYINNPTKFKQNYPEIASEFETRLNIEANKPPIVTQTNIPSQVIQGQVIPSMTKVNQLDTRDAFTGKTLREQFQETSTKPRLIPEYLQTNIPPQRVTIGGQTTAQVPYSDIRQAPGLFEFASAVPGYIGIGASKLSEKVLFDVLKLPRTSEIQLPERRFNYQSGTMMTEQGNQVPFGVNLPKETVNIPTFATAIPPAVRYGTELGIWGIIPTKIASPLLFASGLQTIFNPVRTTEEKIVGGITAGAGALIGGYAGYKYVTTPFEKSLIVKPAKQVNTGDIVIVPIESKEPLSMFQYRLKSELVPGEQKIIETTKLRDWIGIKPISEKTIPLGKSRITLTKTPFWVSSSEEEATSISRGFRVKEIATTGGESYPLDLTPSLKDFKTDVVTPRQEFLGKRLAEFQADRPLANIGEKSLTTKDLFGKDANLLFGQTQSKIYQVKEIYIPQETVKLYHGTTIESAQKIIDKGLLPSKNIGKGININPLSKVYTTPSKEFAEGFAGRASIKTGGNPSVLEINYPVSKLKGNLGMEVVLPKVEPKYFQPVKEPSITLSVKPGKMTTTSQFLGEVKEVAKLDKMNIYNIDLVYKNINKPFSRNIGITPGTKLRVFELTTPVKLPSRTIDLSKLGNIKLDLKANIPKEQISKLISKSALQDIIPKLELQAPKFKMPKTRAVSISKPTMTGLSDLSNIPKMVGGVGTTTSEYAFGKQLYKQTLTPNLEFVLVSPQIKSLQVSPELKVVQIKEIQMIKPVEQIKTIEKLQLQPQLEIKQLQKMNQIIQIKEIQMIKTIEMLKPIEKLKIDKLIIHQVIQTPRIQIPRVPEPKIPKTPIVPKLPSKTESKLSKAISKGKLGLLTVEIRRQGKYKPLASGIKDIGMAVQIGKTEARKTLAASFRIKSPKGYLSLQPTQEFRRSKSSRDNFSLIQIAPSRLSSYSERREIISSRRNKRGVFSLR